MADRTALVAYPLPAGIPVSPCLDWDAHLDDGRIVVSLNLQLSFDAGTHANFADIPEEFAPFWERYAQNLEDDISYLMQLHAIDRAAIEARLTCGLAVEREIIERLCEARLNKDLTDRARRPA